MDSLVFVCLLRVSCFGCFLWPFPSGERQARWAPLKVLLLLGSCLFVNIIDFWYSLIFRCCSCCCCWHCCRHFCGCCVACWCCCSWWLWWWWWWWWWRWWWWWWSCCWLMTCFWVLVVVDCCVGVWFFWVICLVLLSGLTTERQATGAWLNSKAIKIN